MGSIGKRIGDVEKSMTPVQAFKRLMVLEKGTAPIQDHLEVVLSEIGKTSSFKRVIRDLEHSVLAASRGTHYLLQRNAVQKAQRILMFLIDLRDRLNIRIVGYGLGPLLSAVSAVREHAHFLGPDGPPEQELPRALGRWQRSTFPLVVELAVAGELVDYLSQQFYERADVLCWEARQLVELSNECLEGIVDSHNRLVELDKELTGAKRVRTPRINLDRIRQLAREAAVEESKLMLAASKAQAYAECDTGRAAEGPIRVLGEQILKICQSRQDGSAT